MALITFGMLRNLNIAALEAAGHSWRGQAKTMADLRDQLLYHGVGPLRKAWSGRAADLAISRVDSLQVDVAYGSPQALLVVRALEAAAAKLRPIQNRLHHLIEEAVKNGLIVNDAGITVPAATHAERNYDANLDERRGLFAAADLLKQRVKELLEAAEIADIQIGEVLNRLVPYRYVESDIVNDARAVAKLAGLTEGALPGPGTDPRHVTGWWAGLSVDDKQLLMYAFPHQIGALDGLPAADRNTANRVYLNAVANGGPHENEQAVLALKRTLEAADVDRPGQLLLLGFDHTGDGKAVVAIGNPDHAAHTAVFVPGVGTDLADMRGQIDRADDIRIAADLLTPTASDVSVIAWLDYNAPELSDNAVGWKRAEEGGRVLDQFIDGLSAAHDGGPSHMTAVGHSYGSTVVGEAARTGDGIAVDDVIVAGSPGMHVNTASQLQLDPRHVWAGAASDDAISGWAGSTPGVHDNEPSDRSFGANRYHVDTSGHGGYWTPGSASLNNQAAIIVGRYNLVTLDHGTLP